MVRAAIILFLLLLLPSDAPAQLMRDHEAQGLRSFHGPASRIRRSFQSDTEARTVFKHILAVAGLAGMEDRMSIRASAETDNAEAFIERTPDKEERLIFYNAVFMQEIAKKTKDYWSMIAIVAHEVGHHIRLHTMIPGRDHEFELEADYQAGFILRRMGATLEQAQAAFRTIGPEAATVSHPGRAQRVQAATLGWTDGAAVQPLPKLGPTTTPTPPPMKPQVSEAAEAWGAARDATNTAVLEAFIGRYKNTFYADLARARVEELKKKQVVVMVPPPAPAKQSSDPGPRPTSSSNDFASYYIERCDEGHIADCDFALNLKIDPAREAAVGAKRAALVAAQERARLLFTEEHAKQIQSLAEKYQFPVPHFEIQMPAGDVPAPLRRFVGAWVDEGAAARKGRKHILIITRVEKDGHSSRPFRLGPHRGLSS